MADEPLAVKQPARVDERAVQAALRRLARSDAPPWLHGEVARRMAQRLQVIRSEPASVIDWWSFTGASEDVLEAAYPRAMQTRVEPTELLLRKHSTQRRLRWWPTAHWARSAPAAALEAGVAPASAQLVWANMMLHASGRPEDDIARWHRALSVGGFLMFSCFGPDTVKELRALYGRLGWGAAGPEFVDMHDLGDMLLHAGFADPVMDQEIVTLTWEQPERALAELRSLGANVSPRRFQAMRTPRWRDRLLRELATLGKGGSGCAMSFEIVYGHAFKTMPRVAAGGETTVSVDDMRAMARLRKRG
jgi:malonyl-CoA O-methyltransferase